ncbi:MAG: DUF3291 domain-containing protein [Myxococcota bacterium]
MTQATARPWQLAQLNIAHALYPLDDPRMADFVGQLDAINALAEASPGFVWRLKSDDSDSDNATDIQAADHPNLLVNMSVWTGVDALRDYVYKSAHRLVLARRRAWFSTAPGARQVWWWVPTDHRPTVDEARKRLRHLDTHGPSAYAFTFKTAHPMPEAGDRTELTAPVSPGEMRNLP